MYLWRITRIPLRCVDDRLAVGSPTLPIARHHIWYRSPVSSLRALRRKVVANHNLWPRTVKPV
jgi:hypothetical protein